LLDSVVVTLSAFSGLLMENTTRGSGWRFLDIGRRMERALQTIELLRCTVGATSGELGPSLQVLLQIADSSITYRSRYPTVLRTQLVLQLLIADESNPRSVGFQLATLLHQINRLQEKDAPSESSVERSLASNALNSVRSAKMGEVARRNAEGNFPGLEELAAQLKTTLWNLSDAITSDYFSNLTAFKVTSS
jgi:uncharacterized alpha-E superfamily protein